MGHPRRNLCGNAIQISRLASVSMLLPVSQTPPDGIIFSECGVRHQVIDRLWSVQTVAGDSVIWAQNQLVEIT